MVEGWSILQHCILYKHVHTAGQWSNFSRLFKSSAEVHMKRSPSFGQVGITLYQRIVNVKFFLSKEFYKLLPIFSFDFLVLSCLARLDFIIIVEFFPEHLGMSMRVPLEAVYKSNRVSCRLHKRSIMNKAMYDQMGSKRL